MCILNEADLGTKSKHASITITFRLASTNKNQQRSSWRGSQLGCTEHGIVLQRGILPVLSPHTLTDSRVEELLKDILAVTSTKPLSSTLQDGGSQAIRETDALRREKLVQSLP